MEGNSEFYSRIEDLKERAERKGQVALSRFLTPKEQFLAERMLGSGKYILGSGVENTERNLLVILPEWMEERDFSFQEYVLAVRIKVGFGTPGHRDYLGSIMGLGIKREWVGDINITDDTGYVICLKSVADTIVSELTHIGRFGVKAEIIPLVEVPVRKPEIVSKTITVQSLRLDSIVSGAFNVSRSSVAGLIKEGLVSLNYEICDNPSKSINEKDIISMRGYGKGIVEEIKGFSRKGRTIVIIELYK